jgi:hypothetical protein
MRGYVSWAVTGAATLVTGAALVAGLALDRRLAGHIMNEGGPVETLQAFLFAIAGAWALGHVVRYVRVGADPAASVLLAYFFGTLVIGELDLDKRLFGTRVIHTRFFVDPSVWLPYRVAAVVVGGGVPLAFAVYALRHVSSLRDTAWRLAREPGGQLLLVGLLIFGGVQLFERQLVTAGGLPPYFLEESLELVAGFCWIAGIADWPSAAAASDVAVRSWAALARPPRSPRA